MKTEITGKYSRTPLSVKFIQAEPVHPVYDGRNLGVLISGPDLGGPRYRFDLTGNASEIDRGIRDTINGIRASILAMGMGLARIKAEGLYRELNCRSMMEYIDRLCDDTKMYRGSIYNWLYIGEAYIKYRKDLEQVGFSDSDGPSKLPYIDRALEVNQKQEVFDNIKNMSVRDFVSFAKIKKEAAVGASPGDKPVFTVRGNNFYLDGNLAVIVSKKLEQKTSAYLKKVINAACKALEEGEVILPVRLRSMREARLFADTVERLKTQMRAEKLSG